MFNLEYYYLLYSKNIHVLKADSAVITFSKGCKWISYTATIAESEKNYQTMPICLKTA